MLAAKKCVSYLNVVQYEYFKQCSICFLFQCMVNNCDNDKQDHATPFFTFILFDPVGKRAIIYSNDKVSI